MQAFTNHNYKFDEFELDVLKRQLRRNGEPVALNPKAFDLLLALVENNGKLLTKDDLFRLVWANQSVEESNLTVNMSAVRRALGERASEPRFITTVSGQGYRFVGDVRETKPLANESDGDFVVENHTLSRIVEEAESEKEVLELSQNRERTAIPPQPESFFKRNAVVLTIAGLICAAILGGVYFWLTSANLATPLSFQKMSIRRLTASGKITNTALAPDGKLFVYSRQESDGRQSLWLDHADGGEQRQILAPVEASFLNLTFAPDGSRLYYQITDDSGGRPALFKMPVFGGLSEKVKENVGNPIAFSPDGKQFAFVRSDAATRQSAIVTADTETQDERVLYARANSLGIVGTSPAWSRDGRLIAFSANNDEGATSQDIFIARTDNGAVEQLTKAFWNNVLALVWLKDGSGLYAVAGERDSTSGAQIWHIAHPGGEVRRVVNDLVSYSAVLDISADGDKLLAFQAQQISNIWVAPADNLGAAKQITFDSLGKLNGWNGLDWTADGRIVFTRFVGKSETVWTINGDGGNQKQIVPENRLNRRVSLSDDNRFMVFDSNRSGNWEIWRADADGANLKQLTTGGINLQPHISPDGRFVVYRSMGDGTGALWRISIGGGAPVRLTEKSGEWARFSPDGKLIAYGSNAGGAAKIAIISSEGGEPLKIFDVPRTANLRLGIHWTPDGASLTYRDWANGIWKQSLSGGEPNRLEGLPTEKLYGYGWSRDGKWFAFSRGAEIRDVVLIERAR